MNAQNISRERPVKGYLLQKGKFASVKLYPLSSIIANSFTLSYLWFFLTITQWEIFAGIKFNPLGLVIPGLFYLYSHQVPCHGILRKIERVRDHGFSMEKKINKKQILPFLYLAFLKLSFFSGSSPSVSLPEAHTFEQIMKHLFNLGVAIFFLSFLVGVASN